MPKIGGKRNREKPCRIRIYENRIALEIFHVLADGTGAMNILKTLTARYITLKYGEKIPAENGIIDINSEPDKEEMESHLSVMRDLRRLNLLGAKGLSF